MHHSTSRPPSTSSVSPGGAAGAIDVTTGHVLDALPGRWPALQAAALQVWHQQLHARVGLLRVVQARLLLGSDWPVPDRLPAALQALADRFGNVAPLDVLALPHRTGARLQLQWAPWHAPPAGTTADNPPAHQDHHTHSTVPTPANRSATLKRPTMKLPFFARQPAAPAQLAKPGSSNEPELAPRGERTAPGAGRQLSQALLRMADQICDTEVRDLLDLDAGTDCRYQLQQLVFWVSAANQALLRGLMDVNQRDPLLARLFVERGFARAEGAKWLTTRHLKLEFRRDESLPPEATEVLLSTGRDTVALHFSYSGQIELAPDAGAPGVQVVPGAADAVRPGVPASPPAGPGTTAAGLLQPRPTGAELVLWLQRPGQAGLQRWQFCSGPVRVGAADDADLRIDHKHVSGEHLLLVTDPAGRWQVEDRSRNGTSVLVCATDATVAPATTHTVTENPLPARSAQPLPDAGALRLGPLPDDPLLHFMLRPRLLLVPAVAAAPATGRRHTQLAAAPAPTSRQNGHQTGLV